MRNEQIIYLCNKISEIDVYVDVRRFLSPTRNGLTNEKIKEFTFQSVQEYRMKVNIFPHLIHMLKNKLEN